MTQKNIDNYFSKKQNQVVSSDSDSDEMDINRMVLRNADISYYDDLFKKKEELKNLAKVVVNATGLSECWKHFGELYLKNRHILQKYKFCKECLDQGTLKGFGKATSTTNYLNHLRVVYNLNVKSLNYKKKYGYDTICIRIIVNLQC
ncbi:uncharacterized protein LOC119616164 [Lucilia sericata]|uniref:uncharacterized protein LOC119616164 n=1 Tax=Lucilia sericata TaxID=13632 RepID=UPI0018A81290|nr:uncharacterized protein LOC119616164 [Lucilia sericata]